MFIMKQIYKCKYVIQLFSWNKTPLHQSEISKISLPKCLIVVFPTPFPNLTCDHSSTCHTSSFSHWLSG